MARPIAADHMRPTWWAARILYVAVFLISADIGATCVCGGNLAISIVVLPGSMQYGAFHEAAKPTLWNRYGALAKLQLTLLAGGSSSSGQSSLQLGPLDAHPDHQILRPLSLSLEDSSSCATATPHRRGYTVHLSPHRYLLNVMRQSHCWLSALRVSASLPHPTAISRRATAAFSTGSGPSGAGPSFEDLPAANGSDDLDTFNQAGPHTGDAVA